MVGRMGGRDMNNVHVGLALFLWSEVKEEVKIDTLFPRLTAGLFHMGSNTVM